MKEKNKNRVFFWIFAPLWAVIALWNFLTPSTDFSEEENRYLQSFPTFGFDDLLDGVYMDTINTYLNDQFAGRPYWVEGQTVMEYGLGKREVNEILLGRGALLADLPEEDRGRTIQNIDGVNQFAEDYGIPTYLMLVPSAAAIQPQLLPRFVEVWDELSFVDEVAGAVEDSVGFVPVHQELLAHNEEYIYYRTDHHWTGYGAYLAYGELAEAMGFPRRTADEMEIKRLSDSFRGTYHSKTMFPLIEADSMELYQSGMALKYTVFDGASTTEYDSIFFEEYLAKKDKYSYFLGTVQPIVTIESNSKSGGKLLIFKDSYAHALTPMLLEQFSEIRLVDLRYMNSSSLYDNIEIEKYDKAIFLYSADVFAHQLGAGKLSIY